MFLIHFYIDNNTFTTLSDDLKILIHLLNIYIIIHSPSFEARKQVWFNEKLKKQLVWAEADRNVCKSSKRNKRKT